MKKAIAAALFVLASLASATGPQDDDLKEKAKKSKTDVTKIRGVEFKSEVGVGVYSKAELLKFIRAEFEKEVPKEKARKFEKAYAHFGLIPGDMDLYEAYIVLFSESIGGFYHPKTKELRLIKPGEGNEENPFGLDIQGMTLVHELMHAAQDQNFDLVTVPMEEEYNDDMVMGVKGLIEGEASWVGYKWLFEATFEQFLKAITGPFNEGMLPGEAGKLPAYLRLTLAFPYGRGLEFYAACVKGYGREWEKVNQMYADLPSSSEQVLHPEKYWKARDNPVVILLPEIGSEWTVLTHNVHGEFVVRILLSEFKVGKREAEKAAAGWDGDRYVVYERNGKVSSAWMTTWDSEDDAKEFFTAYAKAMAKKHSVDVEPEPGDQVAVGAAFLQRKGCDVLVIDGEKELQKHAAKIWEGTKKEELKKVERFKSGQWSCADHPKVEKDLNSYCPDCGKRLTVEKKKKKDY